MSTRIAIADDAEFIREELKAILEKNDFTIVAEADNGAEIIKLVKLKKPEIVILDIVMPQKSGIEAAREILKYSPGTRPILCSSVTDEQIVMEAMDAGIRDFIWKPFTEEKVLEVIKDVLSRRLVRS